MTEEEIKKEHNNAITFIGQKVYQMCVPFLELSEALRGVLALNREMYKLKEAQKKTDTSAEPKLELVNEAPKPEVQ